MWGAGDQAGRVWAPIGPEASRLTKVAELGATPDQPAWRLIPLCGSTTRPCLAGGAPNPSLNARRSPRHHRRQDPRPLRVEHPRRRVLHARRGGRRPPLARRPPTPRRAPTPPPAPPENTSPAPIGLRTSATRGAGIHSPVAVGHRRARRVGGHDRRSRSLAQQRLGGRHAPAGARRRRSPPTRPRRQPQRPLGLGEVRRHEVGRRVERSQQRRARRVDDRPRARRVGDLDQPAVGVGRRARRHRARADEHAARRQPAAHRVLVVGPPPLVDRAGRARSAPSSARRAPARSSSSAARRRTARRSAPSPPRRSAPPPRGRCGPAPARRAAPSARAPARPARRSAPCRPASPPRGRTAAPHPAAVPPAQRCGRS